VWSISSDTNVESSIGFNTNAADMLQQFVAKINVKQIPEKDTTDYLTNYGRPSLATKHLAESLNMA